MRKFIIFSILLVTLSGCSYVAPYNPMFVGEPVVISKPLPGKVLVYMTEAEEKYVYRGKPTSWTGAATTLSLHLGEITKRICAKSFGSIFEGGADYATTLTDAEKYSIAVTPKVSLIKYAYNASVKNFIYVTTPQVDMSLYIKVIQDNDNVIFEKNYKSGLVDGESFMVSGAPGEEISKTVHKVLTDLMNQAVFDTHDVLSKRAMLSDR